MHITPLSFPYNAIQEYDDLTQGIDPLGQRNYRRALRPPDIAQDSSITDYQPNAGTGRFNQVKFPEMSHCNWFIFQFNEFLVTQVLEYSAAFCA